MRVGSGFYVHKMHVTIYVAISNTPLPTRTVSQVITVGGTMSIFTYDDNWNYIHMMCVDKQNNVCLRQLVTYRKIMCVYAIFLFQ